MTPKHHNILRRGFTLMEMTVSLVVISMITGAVASVMLLSVRGMDTTRSRGAAVAAGRGATDAITDDLKLATAFSEKTTTAVTMTVPDRTGDGNPDTIRYLWTGASGTTVGLYNIAPYLVVRIFNDGAPITIASNVRTFSLDFQSINAGPQPPVEGGEQVLASHETTGSTSQASPITANRWLAQEFTPALLHNATEWKITKVRFKVRRHGTANGTLIVQVRESHNSNHHPISSALGSGSISVSSLPASEEWVTVPLSSPAEGLQLSKKYVVMVGASGSGTQAQVMIDNDGAGSGYYASYSEEGDDDWEDGTTGWTVQFSAIGTQTTQN